MDRSLAMASSGKLLIDPICQLGSFASHFGKPHQTQPLCTVLSLTKPGGSSSLRDWCKPLRHRTSQGKTVSARAAQTRTVVEECTPNAVSKDLPPLQLGRTIGLQAFGWDSSTCKESWWAHLAEKASEVAEAGFTGIWVPPPSASVDKHGYLPTELYNLDDSCYGTKQQLIDMIKAYHDVGVRVMADVVINHRSGVKQDESGRWNIFEGGTPDDKLDWGPWAVVKDDTYDSGGTGRHDSGESFGAAPDIDHKNKRVQQELSEWLNWLKVEVGFDGWRFDFAKGYSAEFTALYLKSTRVDAAVGELWTSLKYGENGEPEYDQDSHRQELCDWIDKADGLAAAFDFTTKGILQAAVNNQYWRLKDQNGKPPGLIGWYPARAVTFIDNHDTGSSQSHWPFPGDKVLQGYAYLFTHPGTPCVFYEHYFDWGLKGDLDKLIQLRRRNDIHAKSSVDIKVAEDDLYFAVIDNQVAIKLGPRYELGDLVPSNEDWQMAASGCDWAIWEKVQVPQIRVELKPAPDTDYPDAGKPEPAGKEEADGAAVATDMVSKVKEAVSSTEEGVKETVSSTEGKVKETVSSVEKLPPVKALRETTGAAEKALKEAPAKVGSAVSDAVGGILGRKDKKDSKDGKESPQADSDDSKR